MALARQLCARLMRLAHDGIDEVQVIDGFVMRLELGFNNYGPLDLRRDGRDMQAEADEEIADWAVYRACKRTSARIAVMDAFDLSDAGAAAALGEGEG